MTPVRVLVMPHKQRVHVPVDLLGWLTLFDLPWASVFAYATAYCSYVLTVGGQADSYPGPMPGQLFEMKFDTPDQAREWVLQDCVRRGPSVGGRVQ